MDTIYWQTLRPDCLGKCCCYNSPVKKIDKYRGIPLSGSNVSSGVSLTKKSMISHTALKYTKKKGVESGTVKLNAFRQIAGSGNSKGSNVLTNF